MTVLDLGDPAGWPEPARSVVQAIAEEVAEWPELHEFEGELTEDELAEDELAEDDVGFPACDLPSTRPDFTADSERRLRGALVGHHLLAYHASRFLPHEVEWVRAEGMKALSAELIERRLRGAAEHYPEWLTGEEIELLRRSGPLTWQGTTARRVGLLWVVAPFAMLTEQRQGFQPLLRSWGGESIGWTDNEEAAAVIARFTDASLPSVVELTVAVEEVPERKTLWAPAVGRLLGLPRSSIEWGLGISLGPDRVLDVLHPDHPRWPELGP